MQKYVCFKALKGLVEGSVSIISEFLFLFLFVFLFFRLIYKYSPTIRGLVAEKVIAFLLSRLDKNKYIVINDVMVEAGQGTSQIDHVVVSNYGIFVIETKNYSGWIFGDDTSRYWTQVIYRNKEKFYNPVRQNLGHVRALKEILSDYPKLFYIPIVVFSTKAELKTKTSNHVVYSTKLLRTIRQYGEIVISDTEKKEIAERIFRLNILDGDSRRKHIADIRAFPAAEDVCPRCGKPLVARTGKYGEFVGCSGYPRCRFTTQVKR